MVAAAVAGAVAEQVREEQVREEQPARAPGAQLLVPRSDLRMPLEALAPAPPVRVAKASAACRPDPATLLDLDGELARETEVALATLGYEPEHGFAEAYGRWVGTENFEERDVPGKIDPLVLAHLRRQVVAHRA